MAGRQDQRPPESKRAGWLGAERPACRLCSTKRAGGSGVKSRLTLSSDAECVLQKLTFCKIKGWLRFRVRDNVITTTLEGRHGRADKHEWSLSEIPKPNITKSLSPPQDLNVSSTVGKVTGLSQATEPLPDHEYKHRCSSPGGSTEHGGLCMKTFSESRVGFFFFPFSPEPPHPALDSCPGVEDGLSIT